MPTGPKGEKRPADVIGNAVKSYPHPHGRRAGGLRRPPATRRLKAAHPDVRRADLGVKVATPTTRIAKCVRRA